MESMAQFDIKFSDNLSEFIFILFLTVKLQYHLLRLTPTRLMVWSFIAIFIEPAVPNVMELSSS